MCNKKLVSVNLSMPASDHAIIKKKAAETNRSLVGFIRHIIKNECKNK